MVQQAVDTELLHHEHRLQVHSVKGHILEEEELRDIINQTSAMMDIVMNMDQATLRWPHWPRMQAPSDKSTRMPS